MNEPSLPPLSLEREADREFQEGVDWYEAIRPGLGGDFAGVVLAEFHRIRQHPFLRACIRDDMRRVALNRFSDYVIYYRVLPDGGIRIASVFHSRRNPAIWQSR